MVQEQGTEPQQQIRNRLLVYGMTRKFSNPLKSLYHAVGESILSAEDGARQTKLLKQLKQYTTPGMCLLGV